MANIKFEIFQNRKNFNIVNWLKSKEDKSYESFVSFLESKSVMTPGKEFFQKALSLVQSMEQREQDFQENKIKETKVEKKETVPIEVEVVLPKVKAAEVEESKPKRRRRKKPQDES